MCWKIQGFNTSLFYRNEGGYRSGNEVGRAERRTSSTRSEIANYLRRNLGEPTSSGGAKVAGISDVIG